MEKHTLLGCRTPLSNNIWRRWNSSPRCSPVVRARDRESCPVTPDACLPRSSCQGTDKTSRSQFLSMFSSQRRHHNGYDSCRYSSSYWLGSRSHLGRMWPHNTVLSKACARLFFSQTGPEARLCSWRGLEGSGEEERNSGESETACVCVCVWVKLICNSQDWG